MEPRPESKKRTTFSVEADPELYAELMKQCPGPGERSRFVRAALREKLRLSPQAVTPADQSTPLHERTRKADIYLQPTERAAFSIHAKNLGYSSWQKYVIDLARERVYGQAAIAPPMVEELAKSNYQLGAVGKNINQIAHAINTAAMTRLSENDVARLADVLALAAKIDAHIDQCKAAMGVNTRRKP